MSDPLYLFGLVPVDTVIVPAGVGVDILFSDAQALCVRIIRHQATLLAFLERTRDQAE